jgi:pectate lyase
MVRLARLALAALASTAACSANDAGRAAPGGGALQAGAAGRPGADITLEGDCPDRLVGWASVAGDGVGTTTGGGSAAPVRPTNSAELVAYARDAAPRVIELTRDFDVSALTLASNKTLIGVGPNVTLNGGLRIRASGGGRVSNVIVKNLRINGGASKVDGDTIQLFNADHVWLDHLEIYDGADGNLDIVHGSNWITISWSRFRYTASAPDAAHRFSTLIGHADDNEAEDFGRMNVSLHHNHWADGVIERMPRVRFGKVHSFNDYFAASGNNYCIRAGRGSQLLIENNYFEGVNSPHEFNDAADEPTAHITQRGSVYVDSTGERAENGGGTPFTMAPYPVVLDPAEDVPARVRACAGPR